MTNDMFLVPDELRPAWHKYPRSYLRLVGQGLIHITPWHVLESRQAVERMAGLALRYPTRNLFPFASRQDNDDVACWAKDAQERVFIIHDFASSGFEDEGSFDDLWSWLRSAIEETIDWE